MLVGSHGNFTLLLLMKVMMCASLVRWQLHLVSCYLQICCCGYFSASFLDLCKLMFTRSYCRTRENLLNKRETTESVMSIVHFIGTDRCSWMLEICMCIFGLAMSLIIIMSSCFDIQEWSFSSLNSTICIHPTSSWSVPAMDELGNDIIGYSELSAGKLGSNLYVASLWRNPTWPGNLGCNNPCSKQILGSVQQAKLLATFSRSRRGFIPSAANGASGCSKTWYQTDSQSSH